jgi:hypothetical protein
LLSLYMSILSEEHVLWEAVPSPEPIGVRIHLDFLPR